MVTPSNRRVARQGGWVAVLALAGLLLGAQPAAAQIWISPDRSIVNLGPQTPLIIQSPIPAITPVVVPTTNNVRIGGTFSFTMIYPGYPQGYGFIKPFYVTDRIRGANFYGSKNYNPAPIITGPFQVWW